MPKPLLHALVWSHEHQLYQLYSHGQPEQWFPPGDEPAFSRWLDEHSAFAFLGQAGRISVLKEARRGGTGYWYAYRTHHRHTRKRYLGRTVQVTLARLEEVARVLTSEFSPLPLAQAKTSPSSEQSGSLLSSKLSPPRLPLSLVERSHLLGELDANLPSPGSRLRHWTMSRSAFGPRSSPHCAPACPGWAKRRSPCCTRKRLPRSRRS